MGFAGGAAQMVAMAQDCRADIRPVAFFYASTGTVCGWRGGAGDNA